MATTTPEESSPQLYDVDGVMRRLSIGRTTVFELITSGALRSVKIGKRRLVSEQALREFIDRIDNGAA